jgi:hypothetical protein
MLFIKIKWILTKDFNDSTVILKKINISFLKNIKILTLESIN